MNTQDNAQTKKSVRHNYWDHNFPLFLRSQRQHVKTSASKKKRDWSASRLRTDKNKGNYVVLHEEIVLVISSFCIFVITGVIVALAMTLQQELLEGSKIEYFFPWQQFTVIFILSLVCAFLSTVMPAYKLLKKDIDSIQREA